MSLERGSFFVRFGYTRRVFEHVKKTNLATFVEVVLFVMLLPFFVWYVSPSEAWNQAVAFSTAGLLEADLLRDIFSICLVVTFVRIASGLRPCDLGLTWQLSRALTFTVLSMGAYASGARHLANWHDGPNLVEQCLARTRRDVRVRRTHLATFRQCTF